MERKGLTELGTEFEQCQPAEVSCSSPHKAEITYSEHFIAHFICNAMPSQEQRDALLHLLPYLAPALHALVDPKNRPANPNKPLADQIQAVTDLLPSVDAFVLEQKNKEEESLARCDVTPDQLRQWAREGRTDKIQQLPLQLQIEFYKFRTEVLKKKVADRDSRRQGSSTGPHQ